MSVSRTVRHQGGVIAAAVAAAWLAAVAAGPARAELIECRGAQKAQQVAELIFGRSSGGQVVVGESEWSLFVDNEITPRFPDGLTVFDAAGQWRDRASNRITREPSKIVLIVLPGNADDVARLNDLVEAYKRRFGQKSVGVILRPACVSF
jgi:hypothetical protein